MYGHADAPRHDGDGGGDDEQKDERLLGRRPSDPTSEARTMRRSRRRPAG